MPQWSKIIYNVLRGSTMKGIVSLKKTSVWNEATPVRRESNREAMRRRFTRGLLGCLLQRMALESCTPIFPSAAQSWPTLGMVLAGALLPGLREGGEGAKNGSVTTGFFEFTESLPAVGLQRVLPVLPKSVWAYNLFCTNWEGTGDARPGMGSSTQDGKPTLC